MNNFQLDNTSVYLGGQLKWDIVLSKNKEGDLEVSDFRLAPISDNIPYNKKTYKYLLKCPHSENIKSFYNEIKGNFWNTKPHVNKYTGYDSTYIKGFKRSSEYSVYNKQFEYLQPLWLEKLGNSFLRFEFTFYSINDDGTRGELLDHAVLQLEEGIGEFHNAFVKYFNEWLKYLNIKSRQVSGFNDDFNDDFIKDSCGNDKVFNVSFSDSEASIAGVNIKTGQYIGKFTVNDVLQNIFEQERPLIESDYIFSTLFKSHDMIAAQLFNLNFCFNPGDMINPFVMSTISGRRIGMSCDVSMVNGNSIEDLQDKYLYTNYEYIKKNTACPYVQIIDTEPDFSSHTIIENYTYNIDTTHGTDNILSYLYDYNDKTLCKLNKLTQPVFHWMYRDRHIEIFNFYEGFSGCVLEATNNRTITPDGDVIYDAELYNINSSNGVQINDLSTSYVKGRGDFVWLYPGKLLCMDFSSMTTEMIKNTLSLIGEDITSYNNSYGCTLQGHANYWGVPLHVDERLKNYKLLNLYINDQNPGSGYYLGSYKLYDEIICGGPMESEEIPYKYPLIAYNSKNSTYIVVSNDKNHLLLTNLIEGGGYNKTPHTEDFIELLKEFKNILVTSNNGYYIGFGSELVINKNEIGEQSYYKSEDVRTFLYRKDGNLIPCMINDPERPNYNYFLNNTTGEIIRGDYQALNQSPELKWIDGGWCIPLYDSISFEYIKNTKETSTSVEIIKSKLSNIYSTTDSTLIDYIYNLYDQVINFDYVSETDIDNIMYNIKLTLK